MNEINPMSERSRFAYQVTPVLRAEHTENRLTRIVERQTARVPSSVFLFAALSVMATSFALELSGRTRPARFIGMWPTPLLVMGVYNKLVKVLGPR